MAREAQVRNFSEAERATHSVAATAPSAESPWLDIVQFDSAIYYVEEQEGVLRVDVLRFGSFEETISVKYRTEDGSAKAGERYKHTEGTLVFEPSCVCKTLVIPLVDNERWATTLEFTIRLSNPSNCELGRYLFLSRVKVIDSDYFPSSAYKEEFEKYGCTEEGFREAGISPLQLLWEFILLILGDSRIRSVTLGIVLIDQLKSLYFLLTTYIVQFAADNVLGNDTAGNLLLNGDRVETLVALAVAYSTPFAVLNLLDIWKSQQRLAEDARSYLQTNIYRKYLNFDEASRASVTSSEFCLTLIQDANDLVTSGFMRAIDCLKVLGQLTVSVYFICAESPEALPPTAFVAFAITAFIAARYETNAKLKDVVSQRQAFVAQVAQDTSSQIQFISDFKIRPLMEAKIAKEINALNEASVPLSTSTIVNDYFPSWLSIVLVASYLTYGGQSVLRGDVQIGTFLATVNIFKGISGTFQDLFTASLELSAASGPAVSITTLLNKQTNLRTLKGINRRRRALTKQARRPDRLRDMRQQSGQPYATDAIPIRLESLCFAYPQSVNCIEKVTLSVAQGTLVAVCGPQQGGKSTFMKLLAGVLDPTAGEFFVPSYLRILHVCSRPVILEGSIWRNLTVGSTMYWTDREVQAERVIKICSRLGLSSRLLGLLRKTRSRFIAGDDCGGEAWSRTLSITEQIIIHLARAFVYDPEVLVMNRPTSQLPDNIAAEVYQMLREFVDNRGVELPSQFAGKRRPRTAFISFARLSGVQCSDVIWLVKEGMVSEVAKEAVSSMEVG